MTSLNSKSKPYSKTRIVKSPAGVTVTQVPSKSIIIPPHVLQTNVHCLNTSRVVPDSIKVLMAGFCQNRYPEGGQLSTGQNTHDSLQHPRSQSVVMRPIPLPPPPPPPPPPPVRLPLSQSFWDQNRHNSGARAGNQERIHPPLPPLNSPHQCIQQIHLLQNLIQEKDEEVANLRAKNEEIRMKEEEQQKEYQAVLAKLKNYEERDKKWNESFNIVSNRKDFYKARELKYGLHGSEIRRANESLNDSIQELVAEKEQLEKKLKNVEAQMSADGVQKLRLENKKISEELEEERKRTKVTRVKLIQEQKKNEVIGMHFENEKKQKSDLMIKFEKQRKQLEENVVEKDELKMQVKNKSVENENLQRQMKEKADANEELKMQVKNKSMENENLKRHMKENVDADEELKIQVESKSVENENLKKQMEEKADENEELKIQLDLKTTENKNLKMLVNEKIFDNNDLRIMLAENADNFDRQKSDLQKRYDEIAEDLLDSKDQVEAMSADITNLKMEKSELVNKLDIIEIQGHHLRLQRDSTVAKANALTNSQEKLKKSMQVKFKRDQLNCKEKVNNILKRMRQWSNMETKKKSYHFIEDDELQAVIEVLEEIYQPKKQPVAEKPCASTKQFGAKQTETQLKIKEKGKANQKTVTNIEDAITEPENKRRKVETTEAQIKIKEKDETGVNKPNNKRNNKANRETNGPYSSKVVEKSQVETGGNKHINSCKQKIETAVPLPRPSTSRKWVDDGDEYGAAERDSGQVSPNDYLLPVDEYETEVEISEDEDDDNNSLLDIPTVY